MSGPESNYVAWTEKAGHDLLAIDSMLAAERVPWDVVCFHAQQVTEKLLKAFLVYHGKVPTKTHSLVFLLKSCAKVDDSLAAFESDCRRLSEYSSRSVYPGDCYEPEEEDAREMVEAARRVRSAILERLPSPDGP
jgi:HEPN domain-containing protein